MTVSAQKQPSRRKAQSKSVEDLLLHPKNLEYANILRAGKHLPPYPTKTTLPLNSTPQLASQVQKHLVAWLKSGDIEQLVQLIKQLDGRYLRNSRRGTQDPLKSGREQDPRKSPGGQDEDPEELDWSPPGPRLS